MSSATYNPNNTLDDDERDAFFREHATAMVARLERAIAYFFSPTLHGVTVPVTFDTSDPKITIDNTIEIHPGVHEQKRIGGPNRYVYSPAFDIIAYKHHPASRMHPEELEDVQLGCERNPNSAIEFALGEWFKTMASGWFENAGLADQLEEEKADQTRYDELMAFTKASGSLWRAKES